MVIGTVIVGNSTSRDIVVVGRISIEARNIHRMQPACPAVLCYLSTQTGSNTIIDIGHRISVGDKGDGGRGAGQIGNLNLGNIIDHAIQGEGHSATALTADRHHQITGGTASRHRN